MPNENHAFRDLMSAKPAPPFKLRFAAIAERLSLRLWLSKVELTQLCEAAFYAALCNIAFNGLGGCRGEIKPSRETNRISLERAFMEACAEFENSIGAQALPQNVKESVRRILLSVVVVDGNLA